MIPRNDPLRVRWKSGTPPPSPRIGVCNFLSGTSTLPGSILFWCSKETCKIHTGRGEVSRPSYVTRSPA